MNPVTNIGNKLRWKLENIQNLKENGVLTPSESFGDTDWNVLFQAKHIGETKFLAVYLCHTSDNLKEKNLFCELRANYRLLNQVGNQKDLVRSAISCLKHDAKNYGYHQFIEWDKLLSSDNGYIENDSIVFEIEFDFKYYDFSKEVPKFTNIVVNVEDTDFHLNKWVLCSKSQYFYDLLINEKSENENTVIKLDMKAIDFCYILASLDPFFNGVAEKNYIEVMKIAEEFKVSTLHYKCEQFLINETRIELIEKIKCAEERDYEMLMKSCIESLKTGNDVKKLHSSVKFAKLKESTKLRVMQRLLDIF